MTVKNRTLPPPSSEIGRRRRNHDDHGGRPPVPTSSNQGSTNPSSFTLLRLHLERRGFDQKARTFTLRYVGGMAHRGAGGTVLALAARNVVIAPEENELESPVRRFRGKVLSAGGVCRSANGGGSSRRSRRSGSARPGRRRRGIVIGNGDVAAKFDCFLSHADHVFDDLSGLCVFFFLMLFSL